MRSSAEPGSNRSWSASDAPLAIDAKRAMVRPPTQNSGAAVKMQSEESKFLNLAIATACRTRDPFVCTTDLGVAVAPDVFNDD
jgi:hypothetical protein